MAQVLPPSISSPPDQPYFPSNPLQTSSSPQLQFPASYGSSPPADEPNKDGLRRSSYSSPSLSSISSQSESLYSRTPSYRSTPASSLSLDTKLEDDDGLSFPSYDNDIPHPPQQSPMKEPSRPQDEISRTPSISSTSDTTASTIDSTPSSPDLPAIADDTAVRDEPSLQVDYLSHEWKEEDIWASWKHIVSKRKVYGEYSRLENASWRTWTKAKYHLRTVSPETLNWLKDCDVTWLYGPLQQSSASRDDCSEPASRISKSNSFLNKKPILKKRSVSEVMLQKSLSSSSLIRQAAEAVNAQRNGEINEEERRSGHRRTASDFLVSGLDSKPASRAAYTEAMNSQDSSGLQSPDPNGRRHIRFDNKVEQCIAVDFKESAIIDDEPEEYPFPDQESSEDEMIMLKPKPKKHPSTPSSSRNSFSQESKGIAMLPSTTLKFHQDEATSAGHALKSPSFSASWRPKLSNSPSQETLRPANPSTNFLIDDDDDADMSWEPSVAFGSSRESSSTSSNTAQDGETAGNLRRTPSGMFMPFDDDDDEEEGFASTGFFGRIVDTVNTARDIGHVIWNVGWRK